MKFPNEAGKGVRNENRLRNVPMSRKNRRMSITEVSVHEIEGKAFAAGASIPNTLNRHKPKARSASTALPEVPLRR